MPDDIESIQNEDDHKRALAEIERLWGAAPGTPDGDRLDRLMTITDAYERKAFPC